MIWDSGTWEPQTPDVDAALKKGDLKFTLHGKKLKGSWVLVRTKGWGSSLKPSWLLIKHRDAAASTEDIAETQPRSVVSKRLLTEIAIDEGGDVQKAASGDPASGGREAPEAAKLTPEKEEQTETSGLALEQERRGKCEVRREPFFEGNPEQRQH